MADILITGGAGFIGSHTVDLALKEGHKVTVYDIKTWDEAVNLHHVKDKITYIEGDILDTDSLNTSLIEKTHVLHLAAIVSVPKTIEEPLHSHDVNVTGTLNVFELSENNNVKRVVYASSAAVYGAQEVLPIKETAECKPESPYGLHKLINDQYAQLFSEYRKQSILGLRYFNVFGVRQDPSSPYSGVISIFTDRAKKDEKITVFGDGLATRDFVSVYDVAQANLSALMSDEIGICNIGTGKEVTINELIESIEVAANKKIVKEHESAREGDILRSCAAVEEAKNKIGLVAKVELIEGLKELLSMKILITGGAGFIGRATVCALAEQGHKVVSIDNFNDYYDPLLKRDRVRTFPKSVESFSLDISDVAKLELLFKEYKFDAVCHLAAQAGVRYSIENPFVYAQSNYIGTLNILEFSKKYGVGHVVAASTSSVYGLNKDMPFEETQRVDAPISIYSATKRGTELLAHTYNHLFDLNITMLRFFTVYGPWGRPDMAPYLFTKAIASGEPISVFNNGEMSRDFAHVDDIVSGIVAAISKPAGYKIYNLGKGTPESLMEFISEIENNLGKKAIIEYKPMQPGDVKATWADTTLAEKELGYTPTTSMKDGVKNFVEWYRDYYNV